MLMLLVLIVKVHAFKNVMHKILSNAIEVYINIDTYFNNIL